MNVFKNHIYKNMSLKTLENLRTFSYIETRFWIKFKNIWASNRQKIKNVEAQLKNKCSYKKKSVIEISTYIE